MVCCKKVDEMYHCHITMAMISYLPYLSSSPNSFLKMYTFWIVLGSPKNCLINSELLYTNKGLVWQMNFPDMGTFLKSPKNIEYRISVLPTIANQFWKLEISKYFSFLNWTISMNALTNYVSKILDFFAWLAILI